MESDTWKRAKEVFHEALERSPADQTKFVVAACGEDLELRAQVEALLEAHDEAGEFLASPTAGKETRWAATLDAAAPEAKPGTRIGPYKLLQEIGEGGFGVVYMAEQTEPMRRRVALKIIKLGMDTRKVIARFEAERQALALMDHPNIARVLDAGATESGRPYFVMELVTGFPITKYCDAAQLTTHDRLKLFVDVCGAVQHAHQKGIIHRDIKPTNVLVTLHDGLPVPKVIDFGIAKAVHRQLTEKTLFTEYGQFIGTPAYMSPEQAEMSGLDVDTRSDVYSLGVLLYELLTGTTPFDAERLREAGYAEIQRMIREEELPKPSTRLSTLGGALVGVAKQRNTDAGSLTRLVRGDLDWIVMRSLDRDRSRRYGAPSELAADIRRHLRHEPVTAGPPGVAYRGRKFLRRHRITVGVVGAVGLALLVGLTAATYGLLEARRANVRAEAEAATSQEVSEFLIGLFEVSDPRETRGYTVTAREVLDDAATRIEKDLSSDPRLRSRMLASMGRAYSGLGLSEAAERLLAEAYAIEVESGTDPHSATGSALAWANLRLGRYDTAERLYREVLERRRRELGEAHAETAAAMGGLGNLYRVRGRLAEAESLLVRALEIRRKELGPDARASLGNMLNLGALYAYQGRHEEKAALMTECVERMRSVLGTDHPMTLKAQRSLAKALVRLRRFEEAERLLLATIPISRQVLGPDHPSHLGAVRDLANLYAEWRRPAEAAELLEQALNEAPGILEGDHRGAVFAVQELALIYRDLGRSEDAERMYLEAVATARRTRGVDNELTLSLMNDLGWLYNELGRVDEAEALHLEVLETRRRLLGDDNPQTLWSKYNLAWVREMQGRLKEAERLFSETLDARRRLLGEEHRDTLWSKFRLAGVYAEEGRYDEAERLHREALEGRRRALGNKHEETVSSMNSLAWLLLTREPADARDAEAALVLANEANEHTGFENATYLDTLALAQHLTGDPATARDTQRRALERAADMDPEVLRELKERLSEFRAATERGGVK